MSEQLYSMRAQGIGKADATFVNFTKEALEQEKQEYRKEGFIFFNVSDDSVNPPPHDCSFEKNMDSALKLQELVKGDIERLTKITSRNIIDQMILEYAIVTYKESLLEDSEK